MRTRQLGRDGPQVSAIGLGCMSFANVFGPTTPAESHRTMAAALDAGIDFWDTANVYGNGLSEQVIGDFLRASGARPRIATKVGITRRPERPFDNRPGHLRAEIEGSLRRLGVERVELYQIHRRDPDVPVEEVAGALGRLVTEGKIAGYGLSEVAPSTLRRAHAVHPCRAVQSEYSLWTRLPELGMIQTCAELGVAFVAFSPLARGMLSDAPPDPALMAADDFRLGLPRFQEPNLGYNRACIARFAGFARSRSWTTAAAALAWVLDQGPHLIPIPATRTTGHLAEWARADRIVLTADDHAEIDRLLPVGWAHGDRYSAAQNIGPERYC